MGKTYHSREHLLEEVDAPLGCWLHIVLPTSIKDGLGEPLNGRVGVEGTEERGGERDNLVVGRAVVAKVGVDGFGHGGRRERKENVAVTRKENFHDVKHFPESQEGHEAYQITLEFEILLRIAAGYVAIYLRTSNSGTW